MKVLIVDDELLVRIGVKTILEEVGVPMQIQMAKDGKEALEIFHTFQPQLVFVDINMPKLYGFDFIRMAKQKLTTAKFVVLTCYNDTMNIQTAVRLGVSDYIIKTELDRKTITRLVYECIESEELAWENAVQESKNSSEVSLSMTADTGIEALRKQIQKEFKKEETILLYIYPKKIYTGKQEHFETIVTDLLEGIVSDYGKGRLYYQPGGFLLAFSFSPKRSDMEVKKMLTSELGQQIIDSMRTYFNEEYSIGVVFCNEKETFEQMVQKAKRCARKYFYDSEKTVFIAVQNENELKREKAKKVRENMKVLLDEKEYRETQIAFNQFVQELIENRPNNLDAVLSTLFDLFYLVVFHIQQQYPDLFSQKYWEMDYRTFFLEQNSLKLYSSKIEEMLQMLQENNEAKGLESGNEKLVEQAKIYIENHLEDTLDLQTVSNYVNLSASYFTRIFKAIEGITFIDYCIERRIERAKMYIDAGEKIFIAAEKVGYPNYSYFSKLFKRITGLTPENYRKRQNREGKI